MDWRAYVTRINQNEKKSEEVKKSLQEFHKLKTKDMHEANKKDVKAKQDAMRLKDEVDRRERSMLALNRNGDRGRKQVMVINPKVLKYGKKLLMMAAELAIDKLGKVFKWVEGEDGQLW